MEKTVRSNGDLNPGYFKGPIVELVNSITLSQAENTTLALQSVPNITVIGSKTAGADGNVSTKYFPEGLLLTFQGLVFIILMVWKPNEKEFELIGKSVQRLKALNTGKMSYWKKQLRLYYPSSPNINDYSPR